MSAEQGSATPAIRSKLAIRASLRTLAVNSDGLHHGTPHIRGMRPAMGNHRPVYQDGALYTTTRENGRSPG